MIRKASDPITSYALLYAALTGILYPIFTLMLLHVRRVYTWWSSLLTIISWSLSSAVLFKILGHLRQPITEADYESGLKSLFNLQTCGGSSAIALCQQMVGQNQLGNFSASYERLHFFPVLLTIWIISTLVLLLLLDNFISNRTPLLLQPFDKLEEKLKCRFPRFAIIGILLLPLVGLYTAAIGYQAEILRQYLSWDVIDIRGWTYGQIVAVLMLVPSLLGFLRCLIPSCLEDKLRHLCDHLHRGQYSEINDSPDEKPEV